MSQHIDIPKILSVMKRRKRQMIIPAACIFVCGLLLAVLLPSVYRSSATILIETQNIAREVIQTSVSGYVEQRLQQLSQVVLGRVNLVSLMGKMNLYLDYRDKLTDEELVEKMRKNISLEPVQADIGPGGPGKSAAAAAATTATIAFDISFDDRDPAVAAAVASELSSLFLEANLKSREETASSAVNFLDKQLEELRIDIQAQETKLSAFKELHLNELPELQQLNLANIDKMERDRISLEEQLRSLYTRKTFLDGQLATIDPYSGAIGPDGTRYLSPKEEHERLRRTYMSLKSAHSEQHPDVVKVKRQLKALGQEISGPEDTKVYAQALREKNEQLTKLTDTTSGKHPDVLALKREIASLNKQLEQAQTKSTVPPRALDDPTNPAYIALKAQSTSVAIEIRGVQAQMARLTALQQDYQRRLEGAPKVDQEYQGMLRDYESAKNKFRELSARLMSARESKGLEESQIGDKFTLIAPPLVPEKPIKPKRLFILLFGTVLALAVGIGTGLLLESMDHSLRTTESVVALTSIPILGVIPYIEPPKEEVEKPRIRFSKRVLIVGGVGLLLLAIHIFYDPLDIIVISLVNKVLTIF